MATGEEPVRGEDGRLELTEASGLVFVLFAGGTFTMGAQARDPSGPNHDPQAQGDEGPPHVVALSPFFLSKYELTQGQWQRFTGLNPSYFKPPGGQAPSLLHPVEQVSWFDCVETCRRMGLSLPTEAQWEYAARGGTTSVWWTGNERETLRMEKAANLADQAAKRTGAIWRAIEDWPELDDGYAFHAPVNTLAPNPFGLHHVHGNVREWCLDGHYFYSGSAKKDPLGEPSGSSARVPRGGSFFGSAAGARSADRDVVTPMTAYDALGFRPARALTP